MTQWIVLLVTLMLAVQPNIDRLAAEGMRFTHCYAAVAVKPPLYFAETERTAFNRGGKGGGGDD